MKGISQHRELTDHVGIFLRRFARTTRDELAHSATENNYVGIQQIDHVSNHIAIRSDRLLGLLWPAVTSAPGFATISDVTAAGCHLPTPAILTLTAARLRVLPSATCNGRSRRQRFDTSPLSTGETGPL